MSEMVERVAMAIANRMNEFPCTDLDCARAAIEAMREPTEAMCNSGDGRYWDDMTPRAMWQFMIDAALSDPDLEAAGAGGMK